MYKKISLYLLSLIANVGIAMVAPILASLALDFPGYSASMVAMIATTPAITLIPGMFVATALSSKTDRKNIIIAAFIMVIVGGILPAFLNSIPLIIACRAILGVGMGLIMPLQATYFAEYPETERPKLFSYGQALCNILGGIILLVVGMVAVAGWRNVFFIYGLFIIIFIMALTGIPRSKAITQQEGPAAQEAAETGAPAVKTSIAPILVLFCTSLFLVMVIQTGMLSWASFYLEAKGIGGAAETAILGSVGIFCYGAIALAAPFILKTFRKLAPAFILAVLIVGLLIYAFSTNLLMAGIGYGIVFCFCSMYCLYASIQITQRVPLHRVALGMSLTTSAIFVGAFVAPIVVQQIGAIFGSGDQDGSIYVGLAIIAAIILVINLPFRRQRTPAA